MCFYLFYSLNIIIYNPSIIQCLPAVGSLSEALITLIVRTVTKVALDKRLINTEHVNVGSDLHTVMQTNSLLNR